MCSKQAIDIKSGKAQDRIYCLIVFLIAFTPRIYFLVQTLPLRTISDEVATMSTGAYFAGLDWSQVISQAGYYGGGFSILLVPIFWLTDNPYVIYRVALIVASVVQALVAPISYHIGRKYFSVDSVLFCAASAVACSFMVVTRTNIFYNEHMLILLSWLIAWLLCALVDSRGSRKIIYSVLLMTILSYCLIVHIRSYVLWIAIIVLVVCYFLAYRDWLISKIVMILWGVLGLFASNFFIKYIQKNIWLLDEGESIRNSSITLSTSADITNLTTWRAWLNIVLGQINTISIYSGIILTVSIVIFVPFIFGSLFSRKNNETGKTISFYFIIATVFMLCIAMTIAWQSISWLHLAVSALQGNNSYGYKAFTYIRYFGPYCGPVFFITLIYMRQYKRELSSIIFKTLGLFAFLQLYWVFAITPSIDGTNVAAEVFVGFVNKTLSSYSDVYMYLLPIGILFVLIIFVFILYKKNKSNVAVILLCVFLLWEYKSGSYLYDINSSKNNQNLVSSSYELIMELEDSNIDLPESIYVVDLAGETDQNTYYLFQFYLNRYIIVPNYPDENCDSAIVFANVGDDSVLINNGFSVFKLDNNEWVYVLGEQFLEEIECVLNGDSFDN